MATTYLTTSVVQSGIIWESDGSSEVFGLLPGVNGVNTSGIGVSVLHTNVSVNVLGYLGSTGNNVIYVDAAATNATIFVGSEGTLNTGTKSVGSGAVYSQAENTVVVNDGTIFGGAGLYFEGLTSYTENRGVIQATPNIDDGALLESTGIKLGAASSGVAADHTVVNYGVISGSSYSIASLEDFYSFDNATDLIYNHGTLQGAVALGTLDDRLENSGQIEGEVSLGSGADTFVGRPGGTYSGTINGDDGIDMLVGGDFDDIFNGGGDEDVLRGGAGNDLLLGDRQADLLRGGRDDDELRGGQGGDELHGNRGDDTLLGGSGQDILIGGRGDDTLTGGTNPDDFVFADRFGHDVITDFDATDNNEDIDLSGVTAITGYTDLQNNHMTQQGSHVVIDAGDGNTITIQNVDIADLGAADFLF